ncbi:zinc finger protein GAI-ASSOCIATED FACTOR 1-like isoform X1 [Salvia miltiorrhiza]|uniref:zinc finger protein GAI-ASSOCIATED FACTOR 1-like isoform X1 n=1 Tax=Salvia miltiorrhiza TaxID=226208 RepID=UPI0025ABC388|nr:zinc finger protein GAI-ASSOCIATED FACTOR 1-like isoform X1 [Salvia miltiorrhiza]
MQENNMVESEILSTESNILNQTKLDEQPVKKKRNLPGMPDPDADVIALSPKTLLATNRFVCEICNKGFQREQNLQLHRRGHNLPWKLRQRSGKELRKRVYVCPEASCVHHNPSRALGDLTGIKKHFCRKHLDKKYKCHRCPKKYALQSDCKAHIKACGTREYSCRCGTLFSRRDSFVTHRAFCDALSRENARSQPPPMVAPLPASSPPPPPLSPSATVLSIQSSELAENSNAELQPPPPPAPTAAATTSNNTRSSSGGFLGSMLSSSSTYPSLLCSIAGPHQRSVSLSLFEKQQLHYVPRQPAALSATALLQKAAQMGATSSFLRGLGLALPSSSSIMKLDNTSLGLPSSSSLNELMMSSSTLFRSKPATLDLLGLGVPAAEASSSGGFSAFRDDSERKYNQSRFCKHD